MTEVIVDYATLFDAARVWEEAADKLDGAWRRLTSTTGSPVDRDVMAAFVEFREAWTDRVKDVSRDAQAHCESLQDSARAYGFADDAAQERLRRLLPFAYRDAEFPPLPPVSGPTRPPL